MIAVKDGLIEGDRPDGGPVAKSNLMSMHCNGEDIGVNDILLRGVLG